MYIFNNKIFSFVIYTQLEIQEYRQADKETNIPQHIQEVTGTLEYSSHTSFHFWSTQWESKTRGKVSYRKKLLLFGEILLPIPLGPHRSVHKNMLFKYGNNHCGKLISGNCMIFYFSNIFLLFSPIINLIFLV